MTGAFIIEGDYDDDAERSSTAPAWTGTRAQPVMVINQLGCQPQPVAPAAADVKMPLSVNGRLQPKVTMQPGEVQLWRIANTSSRSGVLHSQRCPPTGWLQWRQIAQDGVQFADANYQDSQNQPFLWRRATASICWSRRPTIRPRQPQVLQPAVVQSTRVNHGRQPSRRRGSASLTVQVGPATAVTGNQSQFIPSGMPQLPAFLDGHHRRRGEGDQERHVRDRHPKTGTQPGPPVQCTRSTERSSTATIGQVVLLNTVEEWKIEEPDRSGRRPAIDHPFHIHINPFQITEVFDPNGTVPGPAPSTCTTDTSSPATDANRANASSTSPSPRPGSPAHRRPPHGSRSGGTCFPSRRDASAPAERAPTATDRHSRLLQDAQPLRRLSPASMCSTATS